MATHWRSCVITATDVPRLAAFWEHATGFTRAVDNDVEVVLTEFGERDAHPGLVILAGPAGESGSVHLDVNTDDFESDLAGLVARGASRAATMGDGWVMLHDPEGNSICLRQLG
ncbi:MAG TPA: VOC family protein [Mycobacteriales bacterium]|jgi:predicted enzyme related to lactoylglutathione lyase|nr:VOC family protein [Mycobacteriales bacterium]